VEAERLDDAADLLVRVEQLVALGVVGGEAGGQLTAVLQVEQDARHQPRYLLGAYSAQQGRGRRTIQMINCCDPAFVMQFGHVGSLSRLEWGPSTLLDNPFPETAAALRPQGGVVGRTAVGVTRRIIGKPA